MPYPDNLQRIKKSASDHRRLIISLVCLILGIILISIGAILLKPAIKIVSQQQEIDYTKCMYFKSVLIGDNPITCLEHRKTNKNCVCQHPFEITEPLNGDDIILYYELVSYDQTASSYEKSRDDQQLSGHLSLKPAEQCGAYSYDEAKKPIAPCGEIADSMFNDVFSIRLRQVDLNVTYYGMIKDKGRYRNPKKNESASLEDVFKDFAKPKSWTKNIWELDTENEDNNGFENEQFIGWMTTSMKRKPYFRFEQNKLEEGPYVLRVEYNYPPDIYNGTRKAILVATTTVTDNSSYGDGVTCVVIGSIALALCAVVVLISVKEEGFSFFRKKSNPNP